MWNHILVFGPVLFFETFMMRSKSTRLLNYFKIGYFFQFFFFRFWFICNFGSFNHELKNHLFRHQSLFSATKTCFPTFVFLRFVVDLHWFNWKLGDFCFHGFKIKYKNQIKNHENQILKGWMNEWINEWIIIEANDWAEVQNLVGYQTVVKFWFLIKWWQNDVSLHCLLENLNFKMEKKSNFHILCNSNASLKERNNTQKNGEKMHFQEVFLALSECKLQTDKI